jgi:hypothetical protein
MRNTSFLPEREFELIVRLRLPALPGFSLVRKIAGPTRAPEFTQCSIWLNITPWLISR